MAYNNVFKNIFPNFDTKTLLYQKSSLSPKTLMMQAPKKWNNLFNFYRYEAAPSKILQSHPCHSHYPCIHEKLCGHTTFYQFEVWQ